MSELLVVKALGLVTIQGAPMRGRMHEGLSPGGPLVPSLLARANARVGNAHDEVGIEVCGQLVVRATHEMAIATDRRSHTLAKDQELALTSGTARSTYVAVEGGLDPRARTHLAAGIGGLVRAGDRIEVARTNERSANAARDVLAKTSRIDDAARDAERSPNELVRSIRVILGPDNDAFSPDAVDVLLGTEWRVSSSSDRTGSRLDGARIERRHGYIEQTRPMTMGAIEVPGGGSPIVLGPEHPTTGGYPLIAVVATSDLDAFHSISLGGAVRFRV